MKYKAVFFGLTNGGLKPIVLDFESDILAFRDGISPAGHHDIYAEALKRVAEYADNDYSIDVYDAEHLTVWRASNIDGLGEVV